MTDHDSESDELDLRALLRPLRRRWWLVLGIVVIVTAAAYFLDARRVKVYQAETSIYVDTSDNPVGQFQGAQVSVPPTDAVADLARLAQSSAVGVQLKRSLHTPASPKALLARVTAVPDPSADFVDITAKGPTGVAAAALANTYARSFVNVGTQQVVHQLTQLEEAATDQLTSLIATSSGTASQRAQLRGRISQLKAAATNAKGPEQQLDPASAATSPISPRPLRVAGIALFLALLNAVIIVYLLERLDRRVRTLDDVTNAYDMPLLGVIPHVPGPALVRHGGAALDPEMVESMRFLRVNLSLQALDRPIKLLLVTSALPGEGKSTVVRNLALAYREAGVNVVVIDADLRRPSMSRALGWTGVSGGLTSVLVGDADVSTAVVRTNVYLPGLTRSAGVAGGSSIGFLPSGRHAANPPAILGSARMAEVLHELAGTHDLVIVDSPPVLAVSDTLPLLSVVDGVIMVARVGHTTGDAIRRAKAALRSIPTARVFGIVAQDARVASSDGYGYGYETTNAEPEWRPAADTRVDEDLRDPADVAVGQAQPLSAYPSAEALVTSAGTDPDALYPAVLPPLPDGASELLSRRLVSERPPSTGASAGERRRGRGSRSLRNILIMVIVLVVLVAGAVTVFAGGSSPSSSGGHTTTSGQAKTTSDALVYPTKAPFVVAGVRMAVFENPEAPWTAFAKQVSPGTGMRWELVSVRVRNLTRTGFDPRVLHYRLVRSNGPDLYPNLAYGTGPEVGKTAQPLAIEGLTQVELAFQVPVDAAHLQLAFDPAGHPERVLVTLAS